MICLQSLNFFKQEVISTEVAITKTQLNEEARNEINNEIAEIEKKVSMETILHMILKDIKIVIIKKSIFNGDVVLDEADLELDK